MNTSRNLPSPSLRRFSRSAPATLAWTAIGAFLPLVHGAEDPAATTTVEPAARPYVVFAGLDLFVDEQGSRRPVVGGSESEVVVWDEQNDGVATLHNVALSAAVEPKIARAQVTIDALQGQAVYSPVNDPNAAAQAQQFFLLNLENARAEESEVEMRMAQAVADSYGSIAPSVGADSPGAARFQAEMDAAAREAASAASEMASTYANPIYRDSRIGTPRGEESFDGFAVAFEVSSPEPLANAYGVLRLRYRASVQPGAPVGHAIKMFRLRKLDAKPRKVVVRQFGLPPGFTVDSYEVHLYADGRELAANTSPNRVEVTEDEAHQFLILRHAQLHPAATMPAQVAPELQHHMPAAIAGSGLESMLVEFTVTADGKVAGVGAGAGVSRDLPTGVAEELRRVRFLPAMAGGKAVESRGSFAVGELYLRSDTGGPGQR